MKTTKVLSAALLVGAAGQAFGQTPPTIDGQRDASFYGAPLWVNRVPTSRTDNLIVPCNPCDPLATSTPAATVGTGLEIAIPLSAIGNPAPGSIRIAGFLNSNGRDFVSNQIVGGVPCPAVNLADPRNVNFSTTTGNQFAGSIVSSVGPAITVDGTVAALEFGTYGGSKFVQNNRTGFGNSNLGLPGNANGNEIDALRAVVRNDAGGNPTLYIHIAGNLSSDNTKLDLFIDTNPAVGQNQLRGDNVDISFNSLNRYGDDPNTPAVEGLTFDAGFTADYFVGFGNQDDGAGAFRTYADFAVLRDVVAPGDAGVGYFLGFQPSGVAAAAPTGGGAVAPFDGIRWALNNVNVAGVAAECGPQSADPDVAIGSELNAVYGKILNNKLYLFASGNMRNNFEKLQLFFDAIPGGQNAMRDNNVDVDFNALNRMGPALVGTVLQPGLTFDASFSPDYFTNIGNGNGGTSATIEMFGNAAVLRTDGQLTDPGSGAQIEYGSFDGGRKSELPGGTTPGAGRVEYDGTRLDTFGAGAIFTNFAPRTAGFPLLSILTPPFTPGTPVGVPGLIKFAINNSNVAGITATTAVAADATAVTTGVELEIDLGEMTGCGLGSGATPCSSINSVKVAGWISFGASGAGTVSNQVIGSQGDGTVRPELGEVREINFATQTAGTSTGIPWLAGDQFVVVPRATASCYPDCDGSGGLSPADFTCFLGKFRAGTLPFADCDNSGGLSPADFTCFLGKFRAGCP